MSRASWDEGALGILSRTHLLKHRGPVQGCAAPSGLARAPTGLQARVAPVQRGCVAGGVQIEVREDGPVNQSVFDTLTAKSLGQSLGQRQETGTPGLRDQMVPKSSGEGLCSDSLADLGCSQLGDPSPRVSDRPPEGHDRPGPYQALLYGPATKPSRVIPCCGGSDDAKSGFTSLYADSSPDADVASLPRSKQQSITMLPGAQLLRQDIWARHWATPSILQNKLDIYKTLF